MTRNGRIKNVSSAKELEQMAEQDIQEMKTMTANDELMEYIEEVEAELQQYDVSDAVKLRLAYCSWDTRTDRFTDEGHLLNYGLIITAEHANLCGFNGGHGWQRTTAVLGKTSNEMKEFWFNREPWMVILKWRRSCCAEKVAKGNYFIRGRMVPIENYNRDLHYYYNEYFVLPVEPNPDGQGFRPLLKLPLPMVFAPYKSLGVFFQENFRKWRKVIATYASNPLLFAFACQWRGRLLTVGTEERGKSTIYSLYWNFPNSKAELYRLFVGRESLRVFHELDKRFPSETQDTSPQSAHLDPAPAYALPQSQQSPALEQDLEEAIITVSGEIDNDPLPF